MKRIALSILLTAVGCSDEEPRSVGSVGGLCLPNGSCLPGGNLECRYMFASPFSGLKSDWRCMPRAR